jgi:hypothetical protein
MKAIFNSDILWTQSFSTLTAGPEKLLRACKATQFTVVIPRTTFLEFDKQQKVREENKIKSLEDAYKELEKYNIKYRKIEPKDIIKRANLIELIEKLGVQAEVEEPTYEDLLEAHRRACLHESPHPPNIKSDEMRDLVIWMIALRLANQEGGALLISRDKVHTDARGDTEAATVNLMRLESIEAALQYLGIVTPAGNIIRQFLEPVWMNLSNAGLPIAVPMSLLDVSDAKFIQGRNLPAFAHCTIKARTTDGNTLRAVVDINANDNVITKISLTEISIDNNQWKDGRLELTPNKSFNIVGEGYDERLNALKESIR